MTFASSQFTMDMFEMANATNATQMDTGVLESKRYEVEGTGTDNSTPIITLPFEVQENSVYIHGLTQATGDAAAAAGTFKVVITKTGSVSGSGSTTTVAGSTVITFSSGDVAVGDAVRVSYVRRAVGAYVMTVNTTSTTAKGMVEYEWPIYSSGTDCTEAAIKAKLHMQVYRARVTALPGFDTSYKSAATNSVTFSALDPQRPDGKLYRLIYEELGADGTVVAKSDADVDWD